MFGNVPLAARIAVVYCIHAPSVAFLRACTESESKCPRRRGPDFGLQELVYSREAP